MIAEVRPVLVQIAAFLTIPHRPRDFLVESLIFGDLGVDVDT